MNILNVFNLDLLSVGIASAIIVILGFIVYFNNKESITNRTFLYFSLAATFWGVINYLNYQFTSEVIVLWLLRFVIFSAVWYCFFLFQFFYVFPEEKIIFPKWFKFFLLPVVIFASILNLTPFVFSGIAELAPVGTVSKAVHEPGLYFFIFVVICLVVGSIFLLVKKIFKSDKLERTQYIIVGIGTFITFSLHIIFNMLLPAIFLNVSFIPLGAIFTFPFALFTSYAIIRHKLFNVRVMGTAVLVFALSIVSFIEVTLADDFSLIIYRSTVLFFIITFGIVLIRSVLKEVQQREEIARMAEDVRRAYVLEKRAKEELQNLDRVKNQFMATLQHDLRTPLTSIMGYADLILSGAFGRQNKKTMEVIKNFQTLSHSMIRKANDFLDVAQFQLGKGKLSLKPGVELESIFQEIITELEFKAKSKGIYLKFKPIALASPAMADDQEKPGELLIITADREKLKSALFNIIDNAIKYTIKGGVSIKIEDEGKIVKIIISDTGIGIPKEKVGTIFETMFERTEQAQKAADVGKGIGLYLAGQIIKGHNGKIWAESEGEGKGSTFNIELPIS